MSKRPRYPERLRWSSIGFGEAKLPVVHMHHPSSAAGDESAATHRELRFSSMSELRELVNTLAGYIDAKRRT